MPIFESFPKIPRYNRAVTITEKIDGTNAQIHIREAPGQGSELPVGGLDITVMLDAAHYCYMRAGSRNRWISPGDDNFGFARWVHANALELAKLGPGTHYGEWWGSGIQRGYGLVDGEKRFSLFNSARWGAHNPNTPACCSVVPVLATAVTSSVLSELLDELRLTGSFAAPGFMKPEGVVIYHSASRQSYKVLLENDDVAKGTA